ncbi:hypothetical protein KFK09_024464 [Dendrobium nobile]|uniref:Uncharacterized protein n=1 Tax=Dendrobium nobile TaxID=94219 RepID=A0A8T3ADU5_DENNO|nr:hypothetical protein KFK09_024464 [Dendrobium nobile]
MPYYSVCLQMECNAHDGSPMTPQIFTLCYASFTLACMELVHLLDDCLLLITRVNQCLLHVVRHYLRVDCCMHDNLSTTTYGQAVVPSAIYNPSSMFAYGHSKGYRVFLHDSCGLHTSIANSIQGSCTFVCLLLLIVGYHIC